MKLELKRRKSANGATIGELLVDGKHEAFTCEDVVRPASAPKVYGKTAIPAGTYPVVVDFSNRFQRLLPLLLNVPGYAGIRIHSGNTAADTEGCILPGLTVMPNGAGVSQSRVAFNALFAKMQKAMKTEKITITITNG
jgi:hypothetical protein